MTCFRPPPLDIFRSIMAFAIDPMDVDTKQYKLAWICRSWRALALPQIYHRAYIRDNEPQPRIKAIYSLSRGMSTYLPELFQSNIPLIASVGATHFIKHLVLDLHSPPAQEYLLSYMYIMFLECTADVAHAIFSYVKHYLRRLDIHWASSADLFVEKRLALRLVNFIMANIPNINKLDMDIGMRFSTIGSTFSLLVHALDLNLEHIDISSPLIRRLTMSFNHLTTLTIRLFGKSCMNLFINTKTLKVLRLISVPENQYWIMPNPDSSNVVFDNLETLELSFVKYIGQRQTAEESTPNFRILFPNLRHLYINSVSRHARLFEKCSFPSHLESMHMNLAIKAFSQLPDILHVDRLYTSFTDRRITSVEHNELQRWIGKDAACAKACIEFTILDYFRVDIPYWPGVTHFVATNFTGFGNVLQIVRKLPNLSVLTLKNVKFYIFNDDNSDFIITEASKTTDSNFELVHQLNNIVVLKIFDNGVHFDFSFKRYIECIILRLTSLQVFVTNIYTYDEFMLFMCKNSKQYPHLLGIRFLTKSNCFNIS